ncbi:MAG: TrmH family RNA methyltransferase [Bacteroidales bacterium]
MITAKTIKQVKSLQLKKYRREQGLFVVEGEKLFREIIDSNLRIRDIYSLPSFNIKSKQYEDRIISVSEKEMSRMSGLVTPSPVLAVVEIPHYSFTLKAIKNSVCIALDDIQDPGNLGTIIRLASWFGIDFIFCSHGTAEAFSPKVVQASMGALTNVKVIYTDLVSFIDNAAKAKIPVFGTLLNGEDIYSANLPANGIIVLGNEGKGISDNVGSRIQRKITIPRFSTTTSGSESLNVAIAAAIVCSEFKRRIKG